MITCLMTIQLGTKGLVVKSTEISACARTITTCSSTLVPAFFCALALVIPRGITSLGSAQEHTSTSRIIPAQFFTSKSKLCERGLVLRVCPSSKMGIKLKPHQVDGVNWMVSREKSKPVAGGILCDEMGLGKTVQMLETMVRHFKRRTLIIVPKSIVPQWMEQIRKFVPEFTVCVYDGPHRKFFLADVCICPYSVIKDLLGFEWDRVILDEGHEIRNRKSVVNRNCMQLKAKIKWILSGTPVFNKMRDFVILCEFIGVKRKYVQCHLDDVKNEFVLRRTKNTSQGPGYEFSLVELEMHPEEQEFYDTVCETGFSCILEGILRCRQASSWAPMFDGPAVSNKLDTLIELINEHPDEKSLVFTQFRMETAEIKRRLSVPTFILDGGTMDREVVIREFKLAPPGSVFIIQIKTGGVGLNLQEATRVYITQPSWNPATEIQAIARSYRSGQEKKVYIKKLLYTGIDGEMSRLQRKKSRVSLQVVGTEFEIPVPIQEESGFKIELGKYIC